MHKKILGSVLAVVANNSYLQYAKHALCGAKRAGWNQSFMLLTDELTTEPELAWFRHNDVIVWKLPYYISRERWARIQQDGHHPITLHKLYLFSDRFSQWDNVVYLDLDVLPLRNLDRLSLVKGFCACPDGTHLLQDQVKEDTPLKLLRNEGFDPREKSFNTGVFAFSTDILGQDIQYHLDGLIERFAPHSRWGEQLIINLLFAKYWTPLDSQFNYMQEWFGHSPLLGRFASILHFPGDKQVPWQTDSVVHADWKNNLTHDLSQVKRAEPVWLSRLKGWLFTLCYSGPRDMN